ncbi:unnamed protein product, partial [Prorocentrum cordatum]
MGGKGKGGRKGQGKKGEGKGSELASAGKGARAAALLDVPHGALPPGPVPRLSADEAKQLADLHSKAGEEQLAAKYRAIAVSLDKSERAPAPSLQQQVQSAHAAVRRKERALQVEFAKLNRWRAELEEQRKKVAELHSELGEAGAAYKKVVLELRLQVPSEPAPAAVAQVTLEQLVGGTVSIDQVISTDVLEVADGAYDLEEQDRKDSTAQAIARGRCLACKCRAPDSPALLLVSLYLHHSVRPDASNGGILSDLGEFVSSQSEDYIIGGDFNFGPDLLEGMGFAKAVGGLLITTPDNTHYPSLGDPAKFDYFVVSSPLAKGLSEAKVRLDTTLNPHRPVSLTFHPRLRQLKALAFRKPPPLPVDPPFGPRPQECSTDWDLVLDLVNTAVDRVSLGDGDGAAARLSEGYGLWANRAELDLARVLGADLPVYGSRGKTIETFWKPICQACPPSKDPVSRGLKWLETQLKALRSEDKADQDTRSPPAFSDCVADVDQLLASLAPCLEEAAKDFAKAFDGALSFASMRSAWEVTFGKADWSWAKVRGPVSALSSAMLAGYQISDICQLCHSEADAYSDCANVVKQYSLGQVRPLPLGAGPCSVPRQRSGEGLLEGLPRAYALLQLALIWVFTLRNANRVPTEAALEWFTRSDHLVHEIKALRRVGVVSICAYPPDHPLELKSLTPANRKLYAERHGYGLHVHRQHPMPGQGVHIQHAKLALMARYLRSGEYDWVAWFDCDSILMTPEKTLDSIIYQFAGGAPAEPVPEGAGPPPWHVALVDGGLSGEPAGGGADEACAAAAADTPDAPRPPPGPVGAPGRNQTVVGFLLHEGSCNTDEGCRAVSRVRVHPGVSYRVRVSTALVDMEDDSEKLASISVGGRALGECNPSPESDYACGFFDCFAEELVPGDATAGGEVTVEAHAVRTHDDCLCSREEGLCYNRAVAALLEARGLEPLGTSCGMFLKLTFTPEPERREPAPAGPPPPPPPPRGEAAERAPDGEPVVGWVAHAGSCNTAGGCRATAWVRVDPRAQYVAAVSTALIDMEDETEKLASVAVGGRELGECNPAPASDFDCGLADCFQGEAVPSEAVRGGWVLLEAHAVRTNDDCACGDGACHAAPLADMYRAMGENASEQSYGMYVRFTLTPVGPTGALPAGPSAAAVGAAAAVGSPGRAGGRGEPLPDEVVEAYVGHVGSCNTDEGCRESATVRLNRQVAYRVHVSAAMVDMAEDSEMLPAVSVGGFDLGECNPPAADDFDCGYWDCFQDVELPTEITAAGTVTLEAHSVKTSNDCHCNRLHGHCYSAIGAAVGEAVGEELTTDPRYGMFVRFTFTPAAPEDAGGGGGLPVRRGGRAARLGRAAPPRRGVRRRRRAPRGGPPAGGLPREVPGGGRVPARGRGYGAEGGP